MAVEENQVAAVQPLSFWGCGGRGHGSRAQHGQHARSVRQLLQAQVCRSRMPRLVSLAPVLLSQDLWQQGSLLRGPMLLEKLTVQGCLITVVPGPLVYMMD